MGTPSAPADQVELTEFEALEVERVDGVKSAANGYTHLIMKGLAGDAAKADAPADHDVMTGKHTHAHPSWGTADGPHRHQHEHKDDKNHHHSHAGLNLGDGDGAGKGLPAWHSPAALLTRLALQERDRDPASLFKAVAADGTVDEQPDIDGGQKAIALVAQLIQYEAAELAAGHTGETRDIGQLLSAADALKWWIMGEQAAQAAADSDGMPCPCGCGWTVVAQALNDEALAKAKLSAAERNNLPDSAFAYIEPGGKKDADGKTTPRSLRHFPVHDKAHADDAAARIAQGAKFGDKAKANVEAARRKFGENNDGDGAGKGVVAPGGDPVDTDGGGSSASEALTASDLAKAMAPLKAEIDELRAFKARVERMPVPGGPVVSAAALTAQKPAGGDDWAAKAAYYREMAETVSDRQSADGYRKLAREADEKAAKAAPLSP